MRHIRATHTLIARVKPATADFTRDTLVARADDEPDALYDVIANNIFATMTHSAEKF